MTSRGRPADMTDTWVSLACVLFVALQSPAVGHFHGAVDPHDQGRGRHLRGPDHDIKGHIPMTSDIGYNMEDFLNSLPQPALTEATPIHPAPKDPAPTQPAPTQPALTEPTLSQTSEQSSMKQSLATPADVTSTGNIKPKSVLTVRLPSINDHVTTSSRHTSWPDKTHVGRVYDSKYWAIQHSNREAFSGSTSGVRRKVQSRQDRELTNPDIGIRVLGNPARGGGGNRGRERLTRKGSVSYPGLNIWSRVKRKMRLRRKAGIYVTRGQRAWRDESSFRSVPGLGVGTMMEQGVVGEEKRSQGLDSINANRTGKRYYNRGDKDAPQGEITSISSFRRGKRAVRRGAPLWRSPRRQGKEKNGWRVHSRPEELFLSRTSRRSRSVLKNDGSCCSSHIGLKVLSQREHESLDLPDMPGNSDMSGENKEREFDEQKVHTTGGHDGSSSVTVHTVATEHGRWEESGLMVGEGHADTEDTSQHAGQDDVYARVIDSGHDFQEQTLTFRPGTSSVDIRGGVFEGSIEEENSLTPTRDRPAYLTVSGQFKYAETTQESGSLDHSDDPLEEPLFQEHMGYPYGSFLNEDDSSRETSLFERNMFLPGPFSSYEDFLDTDSKGEGSLDMSFDDFSTPDISEYLPYVREVSRKLDNEQYNSGSSKDLVDRRSRGEMILTTTGLASFHSDDDGPTSVNVDYSSEVADDGYIIGSVDHNSEVVDDKNKGKPHRQKRSITLSFNTPASSQMSSQLTSSPSNSSPLTSSPSTSSPVTIYPLTSSPVWDNVSTSPSFLAESSFTAPLSTDLSRDKKPSPDSQVAPQPHPDLTTQSHDRRNPSLPVPSELAGHGHLLAVPRHQQHSFIKPRVKIGVILAYDMKLPWVINKTRPAIELAAEKVHSLQGSLEGYQVDIVFRDSRCSDTFGSLEGIDLYVKNLAYVFIGPSCDYSIAPLARFSYYWGIPILTAGALVGAFEKKTEYRLLTRVQGSYTKCAEFFMSIALAYGWSKIGIVYHDLKYDGRMARSTCAFTIEPIFLLIESVLKTKVWHLSFNEKEIEEDTIASVVKQISINCRIVVLCASTSTVRDIMIKVHELNFDNGEYVFFNIDLFSSKNASETPWYRPDDTAERNAKARKAYESLMTVTLRMPTSTEYREFSNEVKARAAEMYPNFTYGEDDVNSFVGAFHDAVLLYALALNETLAANGSITDGEAITRRMWNRTFTGITGNVSIDANGDRNADYSLLDLNPETSKFEVVANYFGNKRKYEPVPNKSIHWAGGRQGPPPDTPTCGFDGSKCPPDEPFPEYGIVIIVLGSILLIVLIAVFFIYRHIKLEAELAEMNWRVRWDDILFGVLEKNKTLERHGSRQSLGKNNSFSTGYSGDTIAVHLNDATNRQLFTKTGYYKGTIVAIKPIHRSNITVTKPMLLEIKTMKDLQNDHIVRFIGACVDCSKYCVLTEYCPKGSLQDVLENDQIKLDWMFRYSIMQDIVRGMTYLHSTEIHSHGNLKSTNCVVDSRFVVKVTDFGLHHLRGALNPSEEDKQKYSYYQNMLWISPELLRMAYSPPEGTVKGDVYSFAIICQEIVYRNGVFYLQNLDLSPHEIYQKVKLGLKPYFRPTLEEYDCPCDELAGVIRRCWSEEPADRPDFQALKSIIRKLNRSGDKGNILDNLLLRMEQYANNLEALVEERTADYLQQKKKAEDLLYNMLPKKVASQLIRGESVTAEWYDNVSIYFSDICGFTAMSAESTPMEVVDLLNDLYTTFDSIIENFDVYKVETIGDAYMVVSGLPDRNGNLHAREIARMSLSLLKATVTFRIRHRPGDHLKIRIGIHTGPVCAGVVGLKMPRYCLFGDTVNTASRMESNGLPLKIHVSPQCKEVLDNFGFFDVELRGNVEMKGKGQVKTYWLIGERNSNDSPAVSLNIL